MAATDFLNAEILFKTEFTDDQDLEIKDVKHNIIGNSDAHKQLDYRLKYFFYGLCFIILFHLEGLDS